MPRQLRHRQPRRPIQIPLGDSPPPRTGDGTPVTSSFRHHRGAGRDLSRPLAQSDAEFLQDVVQPPQVTLLSPDADRPWGVATVDHALGKLQRAR